MILHRVEDAILVGLLLTMIGMAVTQIFLRNLFEAGIVWSDVLVRILVLLDQLQGLPLLFTPLRSLAVEEVSVEPAVELVDVYHVDTVLQTNVLGLDPPDRVFVMLLLVAVADP